jgi:hypothetical protein
MSCDNLLSAGVATADRRIILAPADENADLVWALRGGWEFRRRHPPRLCPAP